MAGVLLLTQSRGALLAYVVTLFFLVLMAIRRHRRLVGLTLFLVGLAVLLVIWAEPERILTALVDPVAGGETLGTTLSATTLELRLEIWQRAYYAIGDFPVAGIGMNSFRRVAPILYPFFTDYPVGDIAHAHNQLLQTALDLGLPGLTAYLAIWLGSAAMLWQSWYRAADDWLRALALGLAASLLAFSIYGLTDAVALGARPQFLFWVLLGLVAGLYRLSGLKGVESRGPG
jgi:putative inorganic carbon (HCO3(-)) transporter